MRLIHAACKRGMAAVVVTHDAQLASWADRVVFLRDGRVTDQTATPADPNRCWGGPMSAATLTERPVQAGTEHGAFPPGGRSSAGRCGCSAASGASSC